MRRPRTAPVDGGRSTLELHSHETAVAQFRRAAAAVPFYTRLLADRGIRPAEVAGIEKFRAVVPIITKRDVFASNRLGDLLVDGAIHSVKTLITSSGLTASSFSLGMINREGTEAMVASTDRLLEEWFQTRRKKTFVINTCAMGVTIPTSLPGINLSVRSDKALALLQALRPYYGQFVVTSDVYFLKKLLEDGRSAGLRWSELPVQFVMGGEWFPESYRRYLASVLDVDLDRPRPAIHILGSMGAAELGFNLCFETHDTVRLRQLACSDERVRHALFGPVDTVPMIGHYDPSRWFIEVVPVGGHWQDGGLFVFTNLDLSAAMPLVRYQTGDCGYVLTADRVRQVLRGLKYDAYAPPTNAPLLAVAGRVDPSVTVRGKRIRMELLRSALYSDHELASATTGQFHAREQRGRLHLHIQLQATVPAECRAAIQKQFAAVFDRYVPAVVRTVPYFEFREALTVDYERKFTHRVRET